MCTHIWTYIHMNIYNISYHTCVLHTTAICQLSLSVHSQQRLLPAKSRGGSPTSLPWLIFWIWSYGNVPMVRGIILGVRRKSGFDLRFSSQSPGFWENVDLEFIGQMQSSIMSSVAEGFYILEKGVYILEKGVYFRRRSHCGGKVG